MGNSNKASLYCWAEFFSPLSGLCSALAGRTFLYILIFSMVTGTALWGGFSFKKS